MTPAELEVAMVDEARIVWLEHPETLEHVREGAVWHNHLRKRPGRHRVPGRLVGYAILRRTARRDPTAFAYRRRVWWVPADVGASSSAVDPCSVRPGQPSRRAK